MVLKTVLVFILAFIFVGFSGEINKSYAITCTTNLAGSPYACETTSNGATCTPTSVTNAQGQVNIGGPGTVYIPTNPCNPNVCITTNYCCDSTNQSSCGYAILRTSGKSYLCQNQVPLVCLTNENLCFPDQYSCREISVGAFPATAPTFTPTPTVSTSGGINSSSPSSLLDIKRKIYDVGYPSFGDMTKQLLILIPVFVAIFWLL